LGRIRLTADATVEFATVGKTAKAEKIYHHLWSADEIDALLKEQGLTKKETAETT